ncbi:hypothetical protein D9M69_667590 [compost metagenome]
MAALVEDVVGRQQLLGVFEQHLAAAQHAQHVAQRLARAVVHRGQAHHPVQRGHLARGLEQGREARGHPRHEVRFIEQVAGVVAGQRKLGEHDEVGRVVARALGSGDHLAHVAVHVADGDVELGEGDFDHAAS